MMPRLHRGTAPAVTILSHLEKVEILLNNFLGVGFSACLLLAFLGLLELIITSFPSVPAL